MKPARLKPADVLRVGAVGLRTRPLRAFLSALGIAIGIAAMVAVVGISSSSRAEVDRALAALGTNLLTVTPGTTLLGDKAELPLTAEPMIARIAGVQAVSAIGRLPDAKVYRSEKIPPNQTGGMTAYAARPDLPATVGAVMQSGSFTLLEFPTAVIGFSAAARMGVSAGAQIVVGGVRFSVAGVFAPVPLAPELDNAALVSWPAAQRHLGFDGHATTVYTRSEESTLDRVRPVLAATANPQAPNEVEVSRPSDALAAKAATDRAFTGLLLGLGAVALLVGGVGVANTMVISVLERRAEIGLRRSLGATRGQIRTQFLTESLLLSALGGAGGVVAGIAVTALYAMYQAWPAVVPVWASAGGVGATLVIGALAGLYPAVRASLLSPTDALAH